MFKRFPAARPTLAETDAVLTGESLQERFETDPNALNLLRLLLASCVVVWHALLFSPTLAWADLPWPVRQLLEELPVDAFFAISGFLITRSWFRARSTAFFLGARAVRLLPGLWVCLVVTAFVIAPVSALISGVAGPEVVDQLRYVLGNAGVFVTTHGIGGTPTVVAYGEIWNISLWSLWWETCCYLSVVLLGCAGLLRARVIGSIAVFCWAASLGFTLSGVGLDLPSVHWASAIPRLGLMFSCGSFLYFVAHQVRCSRALAFSAAALVLIGALTPNYRLIAAPALAYLCIWVGLVAGRSPRLRLRNDLSYGVYVYGAPVQQALLMSGFAGSSGALAIVAFIFVLPIASLSWFTIERPALRRWRAVGTRHAPATRVEIDALDGTQTTSERKAPFADLGPSP